MDLRHLKSLTHGVCNRKLHHIVFPSTQRADFRPSCACFITAIKKNETKLCFFSLLRR